jgi:APA family basic amino acid/polyamine antiporter
MNIFRKVTLDFLQSSIQKENENLQRTLTAFDLTMMSIGAVIGVGAFVLTGVAAAKMAGPAIVVSYLLAGIVCILTGLLYLELASVVPSSGSSYSYAYASMGEIFAWIVFWFMMMEYTLGSSLIAVGWGGYVNGIIQNYGIFIPEYLQKTPFEGGIINLPPIIIILLLTCVLIKGNKESSFANMILVFVKITALVLFVILAAPHYNYENWSDFSPFGVRGIMTGCGTLILAYVGFDALASATQESINPKRDLPIAIISSLLICAVIYMAVSASMTLIVPYHLLNNSNPMSFALHSIGNNLGGIIVAIGAVAGTTTSLIIQIFGQSRIMYSISKDGMAPKFLSKTHKKYHTPHISIICVGFLVSIFAGFIPLDFIGILANIGTLVSFLTVAIGVIIFRKQHPDIARFKCPKVWLVAPISIIICSYLLFELLVPTWDICLYWIIIGLAIYFIYSYKNSYLNNTNK